MSRTPEQLQEHYQYLTLNSESADLVQKKDKTSWRRYVTNRGKALWSQREVHQKAQEELEGRIKSSETDMQSMRTNFRSKINSIDIFIETINELAKEETWNSVQEGTYTDKETVQKAFVENYLIKLMSWNTKTLQEDLTNFHEGVVNKDVVNEDVENKGVVNSVNAELDFYRDPDKPIPPDFVFLNNHLKDMKVLGEKLRSEQYRDPLMVNYYEAFENYLEHLQQIYFKVAVLTDFYNQRSKGKFPAHLQESANKALEDLFEMVKKGLAHKGSPIQIDIPAKFMAPGQNPQVSFEDYKTKFKDGTLTAEDWRDIPKILGVNLVSNGVEKLTAKKNEIAAAIEARVESNPEGDFSNLLAQEAQKAELQDKLNQSAGRMAQQWIVSGGDPAAFTSDPLVTNNAAVIDEVVGVAYTKQLEAQKTELHAQWKKEVADLAPHKKEVARYMEKEGAKERYSMKEDKFSSARKSQHPDRKTNQVHYVTNPDTGTTVEFEIYPSGRIQISFHPGALVSAPVPILSRIPKSLSSAQKRDDYVFAFKYAEFALHRAPGAFDMPVEGDVKERKMLREVIRDWEKYKRDDRKEYVRQDEARAARAKKIDIWINKKSNADARPRPLLGQWFGEGGGRLLFEAWATAKQSKGGLFMMSTTDTLDAWWKAYGEKLANWYEERMQTLSSAERPVFMEWLNEKSVQSNLKDLMADAESQKGLIKGLVQSEGSTFTPEMLNNWWTNNQGDFQEFYAANQPASGPTP